MNGQDTLARLRCLFLLVIIFAFMRNAMGEDNKDANVSRHLGIVGRVNLGSFYTPAKYVKLVSDWLLKYGIGREWTIADLSCGYGAFFELASVDGLSECRYIGNDIDKVAIGKAKVLFPNVEFSVKSVLVDVSRKNFLMDESERLVIVGNPPYNDTTSQSGQKIKIKNVMMDADVRTRDLGMSSLLAYNKLKADYVAVLHPLSYLVKKANFKAAKRFFGNYQLLEHVVFPSHEFAGTSKTSTFPVIVALYRRAEGNGLKYETVESMWFNTVEGAEFSLSGYDYVTDNISKYPGDKRYDPELLFYTIRDINALRRSRTFLAGRIPNAVDVDPKMLAYYCYIDSFKHYAVIPYYLGNFNVPYIRDRFSEISNDVVSISRYLHQDIFGKALKPSDDTLNRVKSYIDRSIKGKVDKECKPMKQKSSIVQPEFL